MYCKIISGALTGVEAYLVSVEVDISEGLPAFDMVGLLSSEVREARERVRTAIKNAGVHIPPKRITVNLSPAYIRKAGSAFDLAIAVGILASLGIVPKDSVKNCIFIGELSLDGSLCGVNGVMPMASSFDKNNIIRCFLPVDNAGEAVMVTKAEVIALRSIKELISVLNNNQEYRAETGENQLSYIKDEHLELDFEDVYGQESVKRALEIAAAGMHNILMSGTPGSGKSMMARRVPGILPTPERDECIEISKIYSVSGKMKGKNLMIERPFRAPHHTVTRAALIGGGKIPIPGEITLAHNGVLFLDELPEFKREVVEALRQPLEDREIVITRNYGSYRFPSDFMLVAAMNPCPCGYYPDRSRCACSETEVKNYISGISGPLMDRIDIFINTPEMDIKELHLKDRNESSESIRKRVEKARKVQNIRYIGTGIRHNAGLSSKEVDKYCKLGKEEQSLMDLSYKKLKMSVRSYYKTLKIARTIADLSGEENISCSNIAEAIGYRYNR